MKIVVVGIGYVGLANAVCLAQKNCVIAVDVMKEKVELLNKKKTLIQDPDLETFLNKKNLNLYATIELEKSLQDANIVIVSTPTNYNEHTKCFDTLSVDDVICKTMCKNKSAIIVIKSTVPIGYTEQMCKKYKTNRIIFSPEFLREGKALYDVLFPTRIIIGISDDNVEMREISYNLAQLFLEGVEEKNVPILIMGSTEAEAVKLFANTYLALRICYFNELDTFAEMQGLNTKSIINGLGYDPRIGFHYNNPSFGYGGYCLPKDTKQLLFEYENIPSSIMKAVVNSNEIRKDYIAERILEIVESGKESKKGVTKQSFVVGIFRLTMKTNADNYRDSSVQKIIKNIKEKGIEVLIYEPLIQGSMYMQNRIVKSLTEFKSLSTLIVANRYSAELDDVQEKVYTRDLFGRD